MLCNSADPRTSRSVLFAIASKLRVLHDYRTMRMKLACLLAALLATPFARPAAAQSDATVLAMIRQRVEEHRTPGIVAGWIDASGEKHVVAYGDAGPGQPKLDGSSIFELGSITKVFTATVLADMVLKGEVKLDDPVQKYLPATVHVPSLNGKEITLANLAEQNSGLPRLPNNMHPANFKNPYADYSVQQLYDFLSSYQLTREPGAKYEYSNLAVGLLGHVLALRAQQTYEAMVQQRVLEPLHMTHTGVAFTPWMREHLAIGHDASGAVTDNWDLPTLAGAGALRSNMDDMLAFLDANLHTERKPLGAAMALAHTARADVSPVMKIGLNWHILRVTGDTIVWHNGGTGGYRTFIGFVAAQHRGVVILTNGGGEGADDIGFHLLSETLPLVEK
jgi:D-alanyl-D-alanine-carboxypeptidase/D-alanyl-D-alanine-endopeptidase